ncbi:hypothetical protein F4777DRAFT_385738 [Nemania sp. FL0916]|nr:hypothetical protein F4777DRAFT_385738 [Nemania sp. FL0916]
MASSEGAFSTPSPPGRVRTPATPKHGYSDPWEPFSPRKSARISQQQAANRTPSPRPYHQTTQSAIQSTPSSTPASTPVEKRLPNMDSVRRASGTVNVKSVADAVGSLGVSPPKSQHKSQKTTAISHSTGMLPTPAKTPRKQPNAKTEAASRAIARSLFLTEENVMPTPKKRAKKYTGSTLESFRAEDVEEEIEIFTDLRDQLPEVDTSAQNPFYGDHHKTTEPSKKWSKRKTVSIPGEGKQSIEDAVKRPDGVLVVFRGKKIFRKFSENHDDDFGSGAENDDEAIDSISNGQASEGRPMTRSSIKPRLLFPPNRKGKQIATTVEEEEAVTDIEDNVSQDPEYAQAEASETLGHSTEDMAETPVQTTKGKIETPKAPRYAPSSPMSTVRVTRSADKIRGADEAKIPSPFDAWRRSKSRAQRQGQKREGEDLTRSPPGTKRQRA